MKQRSTIVQHSFNKHESITRCNTLETKELIESWKEYQIKFHGKEVDTTILYAEFYMWVKSAGGEYRWNCDLNCNDGHCPDEFYCWCEALEYYLEIQGYKKTIVTDKFFGFEKDIDCDIIDS